MRIGILGGTFDPIHLGHLRLAEEAIERFELEQVKLVLAAIPPHKSQVGITEVKHRWNMLLLACEENPRLVASSLEIERTGPSYTIDTLREIQAGVPPGTQIHLLMGTDSGVELQSWKDHDEILKCARVVIATRGGQTHRRLPDELEDRVERLNMTLMDLSSTQLRELARQGRSLRYLVPEEVRKYILDHRLYSPRGGAGNSNSVPHRCEASA
jgi:nicotinate-nucleotide adenylyltransferase